MKTIMAATITELARTHPEVSVNEIQPSALALFDALGEALNEWQASVEERLHELEQHPALMIPELPGVRERRQAARAVESEFPIVDPGPSKYDREPTDTEE